MVIVSTASPYKFKESVLAALEILPFDQPADRHYGEIRQALERAGTPIGANDLLIAAHALAQGLTLVTANETEFIRVPGLAFENWMSHGDKTNAPFRVKK